MISDLLEKFRAKPPSREEAYNTGLEIETFVGETHFQGLIDKDPENVIEEMFQQLNQDDKDHAMRIRSYMEANGIAFR